MFGGSQFLVSARHVVVPCGRGSLFPTTVVTELRCLAVLSSLPALIRAPQQWFRRTGCATSAIQLGDVCACRKEKWEIQEAPPTCQFRQARRYASTFSVFSAHRYDFSCNTSVHRFRALLLHVQRRSDPSAREPALCPSLRARPVCSDPLLSFFHPSNAWTASQHRQLALFLFRRRGA